MGKDGVGPSTVPGQLGSAPGRDVHGLVDRAQLDLRQNERSIGPGEAVHNPVASWEIQAVTGLLQAMGR